MAMLTLKPIRLSSLTLVVAIALAAPALAGDVSVKLDAGTGFVVRNGTGATERLRVDEATGNVSRNGALFVHTAGTNTTFVGVGAGNPATTASAVSGFGNGALSANTTGSFNSAVGSYALHANTTGYSNTAVGQVALRSNTSGNLNSAFGAAALFANTSGSSNSAVGLRALSSNTTGGFNSAFGSYALTYSIGFYDTAVGSNALRANTTGSSNSTVGFDSLRANTAGGENSALGQIALRNNTTGSQNAAIGRAALFYNTTGSRNVAVGNLSGVNQTTGNDNIYLGNGGNPGESGQIRIGTIGTHTQTWIAGIHSTPVGGAGIPVLVSPFGGLGTTTSSVRFKQDVRDMGEASDVVMKLRPVVFHYRAEAVGAEDSRIEQYGLIAEEVEKVAPELVAPDAEGKPYSVKYHELPAMLVNEMQKQRQTLAEQAGVIEAQRQEMQTQKREQQAEIAALTMRLAQLESRK